MNASFTKAFKKDYSKIIERTALESEFETLFDLITSGEKLPARYKDHPLKGNWRGHRGCHLRPDILVIYRIANDEITFVRINSHSEIFE